jgi:phage terminase large subunit
MNQIRLDKFKPRDFQYAFCDALENKGYRKLIAIHPRRAGKDLMCWNLMIRAALRKVGVYFYMLPTYRQAKLVIWSSITNDGVRFIDYIPKELIKSMNGQELKIELTNGSIINLLGSDSYNTIVGSNPIMIVISEFALCDPACLPFFRPILNANGGTLILVSTPRGKNHLFDMYEIAKDNPSEWYAELLTIHDTKHIQWSEIQKEIDSGEMSEDMAAQEYLCDFDLGIDGSYYGKYIDKMRREGQLGEVAWLPSHKVDTAWDIGFSDSTTIIFFQRVGQAIHVIDTYEKSQEGLEHYAKVLESKPYSYGRHWAPHDIAVREFGSGLSRIEKARQLGIKFEIKDNGQSSALPNLSIMDGIEAVRSSFVRMWIDDKKCASLIRALENYRKEWDAKHKVYKDNPLHNDASHFADAFRYLVLSLSKSRDGQTTAEELKARHMKAMYGENNHGFGQQVPHLFRQ